MRPGLLDGTRLPLPLAEFLGADKVAVLAPHRTFPLAGLLQVLFPGNLCIVWSVIAAIGNILLNRIMHALDQAAVYREAAQGGEKTLGLTVGGIDLICVAPFGNDVPV